jgi:hypothetical protein
MTYHLLADLVVFVHFLFVLFALLGALLVIRWPKIMWLHLPAALIRGDCCGDQHRDLRICDFREKIEGDGYGFKIKKPRAKMPL